ncbi:MAG: transcriptional regulator [Alphaproteobacteria bacterium]|nr:transcriptional regulator [Alphaproteobacteria bacterium]
MSRRSKTLHVEMVLHHDGSWRELSPGDAGNADGRSGPSAKKPVNDRGVTELDTLSRLLSARNVELLKLIRARKPQSIAELAKMSGRPKASLTLTLKRFSKYGIVRFIETPGVRKIPVVACNRLRIDIAIT